MEKKFKIHSEDIKQLIPDGSGSGIASDMVTVDGLPINYMYREEPENQHDSGWRFFSGNETQEYADQPENFNFYDLNTIANYDPIIIGYLHYEIGTTLEKKDGEKEFFVVNDEDI